MCSEIGHFHCAVISIMIKYDFKHLGRSGALAIGEAIENEASQRKQLEVRSFQGLVARITEPTIQGIGGREQNTVTREWQEKEDWPSLTITLGRSYTYTTQILTNEVFKAN